MDYLTIRQSLGDRIRTIRQGKGITQERLAELIGKTTEHMSFIERGERNPSFEVLIDLANALDVTLSYLLDIEAVGHETTTKIPAPIPVPQTLTDPIQEPIKSKDERKTDLERMQESFKEIKSLQQLANEYGIVDIFQDNGGKVLQLLIILGLKTSPGREGNDAIDEEGNEYELKTINHSLRRNAGITTHHHLTKEIINKYRAVKAWCIAIYNGIELVEIWKVYPPILESVFRKWENDIDKANGRPLNNPKIPMRYVRAGEIVYQNPNEAGPYVQKSLQDFE
jgi:transcriptional regulator with XRE-family HTH domain